MGRFITVGILVILCTWFIGLHYFVGLIPKQRDETHASCEAIVVLTGGSDRVHEALTLLSNNKADRLFISGIGKGADLSATLILSGTLPDSIPSLLDRIELGYEAGNTRENAKEIAAWVDQNHIGSVCLVTSNYHTPRSILELTSRLPHIAIIPHPVFPGHVRVNEWWQHTGTLSLVLREYHKYIASGIRIFLYS